MNTKKHTHTMENYARVSQQRTHPDTKQNQDIKRQKESYWRAKTTTETLSCNSLQNKT